MAPAGSERFELRSLYVQCVSIVQSTAFVQHFEGGKIKLMSGFPVVVARINSTFPAGFSGI